MFIKIVTVTRKGANTPPETGAMELVRIDYINRVTACVEAGMFPCLRLTLADGTTVLCTGTLADFIAALDGLAEAVPEPECEPDAEPNERDTEFE